MYGRAGIIFGEQQHTTPHNTIPLNAPRRVHMHVVTRPPSHLHIPSHAQPNFKKKRLARLLLQVCVDFSGPLASMYRTYVHSMSGCVHALSPRYDKQIRQHARLDATGVPALAGLGRADTSAGASAGRGHESCVERR